MNLEQQTELMQMGRTQAINDVKRVLREKMQYFTWQAERASNSEFSRQRYGAKASAIGMVLENLEKDLIIEV